MPRGEDTPKPALNEVLQLRACCISGVVLIDSQARLRQFCAMNSEIRARLFALSDLMQHDKDPKKLKQLVNEILRLVDRIEGHKREEKPN